MAKIYERNWSVAQNNELVLPANEPYNCFALDFAHEFSLQKLIVKQASGTPVAFTVDVFNRQVCAISDGESLSADISEVDEDLARVLPTQEADAGGKVQVFEPVGGYAFRNMEGTSAVPVRKVYLKINPDDGSEETSWEVALAGVMQGASQ